MTPTAGLQHIPFQNHCWCDGKGRAEHGETRSSFGLGRLQELEGASRGMGTAPCRTDLGQTQPAGTSPEGSDSLCHKARAEGNVPGWLKDPYQHTGPGWSCWRLLSCCLKALCSHRCRQPRSPAGQPPTNHGSRQQASSSGSCRHPRGTAPPRARSPAKAEILNDL